MTRLKYSVGIFCLIFLLGTVGCLSGSKNSKKKAASKDVYLKNNIHSQEKAGRGGDIYYNASYANFTSPGAGHVIFPVNTLVTIEESFGIKGKKLLMTSKEDGKKIHFEVNARRLGMDMWQYADLITSPVKVSLAGLSGKDKKGIKDGRAYKGMSKKGVQMALGYPAPHRTPSLDHNRWVFWKTRHSNFTVEFDAKGRVKQIW